MAAGREVNREMAVYRPRSPRTMWPALMLAANRKDSVRGRTVILVDSIITRNGFNQSGAPFGRKWAINIFGNFNSLDIIIDIHVGSPSDRVKIRWLDVLNMYGTRPIILIRIIVINMEEMVLLSPLRCDENVRFSWAMIVNFIMIVIMVIRLFIGQNEIWINMIKIMLIHKKNGDGIIELKDDGSNEEKISLIMQNMV
jgi:hypothetical protein